MKTVGMMLKCDRCPEEVFVIRNKCRPIVRCKHHEKCKRIHEYLKLQEKSN